MGRASRRKRQRRTADTSRDVASRPDRVGKRDDRRENEPSIPRPSRDELPDAPPGLLPSVVGADPGRLLVGQLLANSELAIGEQVHASTDVIALALEHQAWLVHRARDAGSSWSDIGGWLGISR